jgi:hypothetical protein
MSINVAIQKLRCAWNRRGARVSTDIVFEDVSSSETIQIKPAVVARIVFPDAFNLNAIAPSRTQAK